MAILTTDEVRDHIETDLVDDALDRLIDNANQEIIDRLGALASHTEFIDGDGLESLVLARKADSITSASERIDDTDNAVASDDYELMDDGYNLRRKQGTLFPAATWRGLVTVVYVPFNGVTGETAMREKLLVDLVRLDVAYRATQSQSIGGVSQTSLNHKMERDYLFAGALSRNRRLPLA